MLHRVLLVNVMPPIYRNFVVSLKARMHLAQFILYCGT